MLLSAMKTVTLILSFVIFPKESNWRYGVGAMLVLGGLTVASLEKQRNKRKQPLDRKISEESGSNKLRIDPKISVPDLPLSNSIQSEDHNSDRNDDGDNSSTERQPLINLDVELGRSGSASGPERRR